MCQRDIGRYVTHSDARVDELLEILEIERVARHWINDLVPPRPKVEQCPYEKEEDKDSVDDAGRVEIRMRCLFVRDFICIHILHIKIMIGFI